MDNITLGQLVSVKVSFGIKVNCTVLGTNNHVPGVCTFLTQTTENTAFFNKGEQIIATKSCITPIKQALPEPDLLNWIVAEEHF